MSRLIAPAAVTSAATATGQRMLAEARARVSEDNAACGVEEAADRVVTEACAALTYLVLAMNEERADACQIVFGLGVAMGNIIAQQGGDLATEMLTAVRVGLDRGLREAAAAFRPRGTA